MHWSWHVANKSITELRHADIEVYLAFCQSPPDAWISVKKCPRFTDKGGFISTQDKISNEQGYAKISLLFESEAKLELWAKSPEHNNLVAELDPYRTKPWEAAREFLPA